MLNIFYTKCQKGLGVATEYVFIFQKIVHSLYRRTIEKIVLYAHAVNWARLQPSTSISVHCKLVHSKIVHRKIVHL